MKTSKEETDRRKTLLKYTQDLVDEKKKKKSEKKEKKNTGVCFFFSSYVVLEKEIKEKIK